MIDDAPSKPVEPNPQTQPPPVPPPPDRPTPPNTEQVPNNRGEQRITDLEDRIRLGERWMIYLTAAIAFFGLCSVIVAVLQWQSMQGQIMEMKTAGNQVERQVLLASGQLTQSGQQTTIMQRQLRQDQRPWIGFKFNWPTVKDTKGEPLAVIQFTDDKPLTIPLEFTNTGKTAARNVEAQMFVEVVKKERSPKLESTKVPGFGFTAGMLFPNVPAQTWAIRQKAQAGTNGVDELLKHSEREDLVAHRSYIAVYGLIQYEDIFTIKHWTKFCMWFALPSSESMLYNAKSCSDYNNVDNN